MTVASIQEMGRALGGISTIRDEMASDVSVLYPLNCAPVDIPMGGGLAAGKIIEEFGPESVGKSTWASDLAFGFCEYWESRNDDNYVVLWIECETALDKERLVWRAPKHSQHFWFSECETVEDMHEIARRALQKAIEKGIKMMVVVDTLAALETRNDKKGYEDMEKEAQARAEKEAKGEADDDEDDEDEAPSRHKKKKGVKKKYYGGMMEKPRLLRAIFRDLTPLLGQAQAPMILVNQTYTGQSKNPYLPPPEVSYGGGAVRYHSSVRVELTPTGKRIIEELPSGDSIGRGIITEAFTKKNKLIAPHQTFRMVIHNENGLDRLETLLLSLRDNKILEPKGSWTTIEYPETTFALTGSEPKMAEFKWQSTDKLRLKITEVPWLYDWLNYKVYLWYAARSPLLKIKIIGKVWEYERSFFGTHKTMLDEKEREVALIRHLKVMRDQEKLEEEDLGKEAVEVKKTMAEKKKAPPPKAKPGKRKAANE